MPVAQILVVGDDRLVRLSLSDVLERERHQVTAVETAAAGLEKLAADFYDVVLLDCRLPDADGLELLERIRHDFPLRPIVVMTAHSSVEHAVEAMSRGATDYLSRPFQDEEIVVRVRHALEVAALRRQVRTLERERPKGFNLKQIVGNSPALEHVLRLVEKVIQSGDTTVLIQGESGTGKDVLARGIHYESPKAAGPFMNITCTALPDNLLESELFGYEKGAFTDARTRKQGLIELAEGGTIFLDEIGDMSLPLQGKLLRFLEEKTFRRVGGQTDIRVHARVVAATNKDLRALVSERAFREDLYFRLKVIPIRLPPLRERKEDIPLLVEHFVQSFNEAFRKEVKGVTPAFLKCLEKYDWPGNIRELKNTIERAMILGSADYLDADDVPMELFDDATPVLDGEDLVKLTSRGIDLDKLERSLVRQALDLASQNQVRAARLLGLSRDQMRCRMDKFGFGKRSEPAPN